MKESIEKSIPEDFNLYYSTGRRFLDIPDLKGGIEKSIAGIPKSPTRTEVLNFLLA